MIQNGSPRVDSGSHGDPTWLKQPGDAAVAWFGAALIGYGTFLTTVGFYRLATGKGKKD